MKTFVLCAVLPLLLVGCGTPTDTTSAPTTEAAPAKPKVTLEKFNQIKAGMTLAEVEALIGKGTEVSRVEFDDVPSMVMYQWEGDGWGVNMNAMFQGDKLVQKAQLGLK